MPTTKTRKVAPNPEGLAEAISKGAHLNRNTGGVRCHVSLLLEQLPADLEPKIRAAVNADPTMVSASSLAQLLTDNGYEIRAASINRHRHRGTATGCRCPK